MDGAGRIVIPKALRDAAGLTAGSPVDIRVVGGHIEIDVPATPMRLVERDGALVAVPDEPLPILTSALVRETLESTRR